MENLVRPFASKMNQFAKEIRKLFNYKTTSNSEFAEFVGDDWRFEDNIRLAVSNQTRKPSPKYTWNYSSGISKKIDSCLKAGLLERKSMIIEKEDEDCLVYLYRRKPEIEITTEDTN